MTSASAQILRQRWWNILGLEVVPLGGGTSSKKARKWPDLSTQVGVTIAQGRGGNGLLVRVEYLWQFHAQ